MSQSWHVSTSKLNLWLTYYFRLKVFNKKKPHFSYYKNTVLTYLSCCNLAISYVYVENHIKYKETQAYFFQFVSDLSVDSVYINNKNMLQQWKGLGNRLVYNFYSLPLMAIAHHKLEVFYVIKLVCLVMKWLTSKRFLH